MTDKYTRKHFYLNTVPPIPEELREQRRSCPYCGRVEIISMEKDRVLNPLKNVPTELQIKAMEWKLAKGEEHAYLRSIEYYRFTGRVYIKRHPYRGFCSTGCAVDFAGAAYNAGYRIKK